LIKLLGENDCCLFVRKVRLERGLEYCKEYRDSSALNIEILILRESRLEHGFLTKISVRKVRLEHGLVVELPVD